MTERPTLKDVAREAGVHTSTASRALNKQARSVVNPETVDRVLEAAKRLGYAPHPLARGLRTNRTMTIGMVIPDVENPLFGPIIAGVESELGVEGYSLLIVNTEPQDPETNTVIETLVDRRVDGLILATASKKDPLLGALVGHLPMVLVNRSTDSVALPAILGDDAAGIRLAVEHLATLGHATVGHVAGPQTLSTGVDRLNAFMHWTREYGLELDASHVEHAEWFQIEPGYAAARTLLSRRPDITAIVAANDLIALGCYRAIQDAGKVIGQNVSVTGYNDMPLVSLMQPSLTSVRVPYRAMGAEAAKRLMSLIADPSTDAGSIRLAPELSIRDSTGPAAT